MDRKRILWLCSWYPGKTEPFNGDFIQRHARAAALYNDIYVIHVAAVTGREEIPPESSPVKTGSLTEQVIYFKKSTRPWGRLLAHFRLLSLYRRAVRHYLVTMGRPHLVHVQVPVWAGAAALWLKRWKKIPFVVTEHWGIYNDIEVNNYSRKPARFRRYTRKIFREANRFISVSRYLADGVNRLVGHKAFTLVPNVADTGLFCYREKSGGRFRFLHVSNMVPLKNAAGILRAFRELIRDVTTAELVMVGDTDPAIREYAAGLDFPDGLLWFRGEVPYEQVAAEMQASDCLVLFSHIENSPCVIGEALCCGLPVIATKVGGIPELVDESNSILVTPKDEPGLISAMKNMINRYSVFDRKAIAGKASEKFNYQAAGKTFDEIYRRVNSG